MLCISRRLQFVSTKVEKDGNFRYIDIATKSAVCDGEIEGLPYFIEEAVCFCLCIKVGHEGNYITLHGIWSGNDITSDLLFRKGKLVALWGMSFSKSREDAGHTVKGLWQKCQAGVVLH